MLSHPKFLFLLEVMVSDGFLLWLHPPSSAGEVRVVFLLSSDSWSHSSKSAEKDVSVSLIPLQVPLPLKISWRQACMSWIVTERASEYCWSFESCLFKWERSSFLCRLIHLRLRQTLCHSSFVSESQRRRGDETNPDNLRNLLTSTSVTPFRFFFDWSLSSRTIPGRQIVNARKIVLSPLQSTKMLDLSNKLPFVLVRNVSTVTVSANIRAMILLTSDPFGRTMCTVNAGKATWHSKDYYVERTLRTLPALICNVFVL